MHHEGRQGYRALAAGEWLESPDLGRLVVCVAQQYNMRGNDGEDLFQQVCIALWEQGLKTTVSAAWVSRVATNKAVDSLRHAIRVRRREQAYAEVITGSARSPELDHLLHARTASLPPKLRHFYDLHYGQGLSEREIARRLDLCRASVRWLDQRCRRFIMGLPSRRGRPQMGR